MATAYFEVYLQPTKLFVADFLSFEKYYFGKESYVPRFDFNESWFRNLIDDIMIAYNDHKTYLYFRHCDEQFILKEGYFTVKQPVFYRNKSNAARVGSAIFNSRVRRMHNNLKTLQHLNYRREIFNLEDKDYTAEMGISQESIDDFFKIIQYKEINATCRIPMSLNQKGHDLAKKLCDTCSVVRLSYPFIVSTCNDLVLQVIRNNSYEVQEFMDDIHTSIVPQVHNIFEAHYEADRKIVLDELVTTMLDTGFQVEL